MTLSTNTENTDIDLIDPTDDGSVDIVVATAEEIKGLKKAWKSLHVTERTLFTVLEESDEGNDIELTE